MIKTILFIITILFSLSCSKDKNIEPQNSNLCGTVASDDTLNHKYIIKLQVDGLSSPDSVDFVSNTAYNMLGNHFFKRYKNPSLTLIETGLVVGKAGNDITIIIYNSDTSKSFTSKIFVNNTLRIQQVGNTNSITQKNTTNYYF